MPSKVHPNFIHGKFRCGALLNRKKTIHWLSSSVSFIHSAHHFFLSSIGQRVAAKWEKGQPLLIYLTKDWKKEREKEELTAVTERKREGIQDRWPAASLWKVSFHYISHNPHHVSTHQLLSASNSTIGALIIKEHLESDQWWLPTFHHWNKSDDKILSSFWP